VLAFFVGENALKVARVNAPLKIQYLETFVQKW
jgi:hypothetical protein